MKDKTIVLKKDGHWYIINSSKGDEREILLAILEYAENRKYNLKKEEVMSLINQLGYKLEEEAQRDMAS